MKQKSSNSKKKDMVDNPEHYMIGGMDVIDFTRMKLTKEQFFGAMMFQVFKYAARCQYKGELEQDLEKMNKYGKWALQTIRDEPLDKA